MQTERRTRDRVRLFFWAVLTVVCLVAVLVARQQQVQGLQRKADAARERAVRFTQNVLADQLDARRVARPIGRSGYDELLTQVKHGLFNDQRVVRLRVWRADGLLVFTTDHRSEIGVTMSDDANLRSALRGDLVTAVVNESFAPDDSTTPEPTTLFSTLIPLRTSDRASVFGAVQIDNDYQIMVDASSHPWKQMQVAFGIVALLCLVMTIVSFVWSRRPAEVAGFGRSRRDARAAARDEKEAVAALAEATKLRERVGELEAATTSIAEQQLDAAAETERLLRAELEASRAETQRVEQELEAIERTRSEEALSQQGQLDQVRAQARLAEEDRQRVLAEAAKARTDQPVISAEAEARIRELTEQLERSEAERAMLRAGRPETVYEARNRQLEDELAQVRGQLTRAEERTPAKDASKGDVDPDTIAALEARIAVAEERARQAERLLDEADAVPDGEGPERAVMDGGELRGRLVRSTDARRRGIATPEPAPTPGLKRR